MILKSVKNGPLIWPPVEENGETRTKKYAKLSAAEKIQVDCDMKATNIILQGLPADIYSLMTPPHFNTYQSSYNNPQLQQQFSPSKYGSIHPTQHTHLLIHHIHNSIIHPFHHRFDVLVFSLGDDPIAYLNKAMAFLTAVASSRFPSTNNQLLTSSNLRNQATIQDDRQGLLNATTVKTKYLDTYDFDYDDISNEKVVLMANISNYGSDVISEEKANKEQNNESLTAELERYKERVKTFEQRLNIDLSYREKMIDSQIDDMIKEKLALKE
nr:hypothetical protein [Tanacetum cinerariifolium]